MEFTFDDLFWAPNGTPILVIFPTRQLRAIKRASRAGSVYSVVFCSEKDKETQFTWFANNEETPWLRIVLDPQGISTQGYAYDTVR